MARTREFLLFSDCIMANPNGDMINDNRPRQDERTGKLEMSDVRIKRYVRDEWVNNGEKVFVKPVKNEKGLFIDCKGVAKKVIKEEGIKSNELEDKLKSEYIDVKLFGAVITTPKFNIAGPLQVMWSKSVNEAEVKFTQGTSVFTAAKSEASQGTIWSKYYTPYALFKTYMVYNNLVAKRQNIDVSEDDIKSFRNNLVSGIRNYKSTSKNQLPRVLLEVVYNKNHIDGELDYIDVEYSIPDIKLRSIDKVSFNLKMLVDYYKRKRNTINVINIYSHPHVNLINGTNDFKYYDI